MQMLLNCVMHGSLNSSRIASSIIDPDGDKASSIFWDPPPGEVFHWQNTSPARPRSLRIYEGHVGISGSNAHITTYNEFTENVRKPVSSHPSISSSLTIESCRCV